MSFHTGDTVDIPGFGVGEIRSGWPAEDKGPVSVVFTGRDGGITTAVFYAEMPELQQAKLVRAVEVPVTSTAGDVPPEEGAVQ